MKGWLGITLGDPAGIGPEVTLKALAKSPGSSFKYLILGDEGHCRALNEQLGLNLPLRAFNGYEARPSEGQFFISQAGPVLHRRCEPGSRVTAESAIAALKEGGERSMLGELDGIVTAPLNKESIIRLGNPFTGQTEYLSELAGASRTAMMLLGADDRGRWLRVALVTTHIPLRAVADHLDQARIEQTIELAAEACSLLQLSRARVAVCGLNPHAGEGGEIGDEEITIIRPAVESVRKRGVQAEGPMPADTLFHFAYKGDFEAVVAMYHDQGLAPLKMIGFESGINWTLGLPFIRTSPDHGTAFDIAGSGQANPSSMIAALELAQKLAAAR